MDEKRVQRIFLSAVAIILAAACIYLYTAIAPKKDKNNVVPKNVKLFPEDTTKIYDSKIKAYNDLNKEQQQKVKDNSVNVNLGQVFGDGIGSDTSTQKQNVQPEKAEEQRSVKKEQVQVQRQVRERTKREPFKSTVQVETEPVKGKTENTPVNNEPTSGFGIYSAKRKDNSTTQETKAPQNNFYPAYFEEDTKIKSGSPIVLVLRSDAVLEGISFKKNSTMYGYATDAGNYFDIRISSIKNTDGNSYHVNVLVYNEKYGRGIAHEGNLDTSVKESSDQTANDVASNLPAPTTAGQTGLNLATRTVTNTVRNLTKRRQPEISIIQGYKIFVKSE